MWCKICNTETPKAECEICGAKTEQEIPVEVCWCDHCKTPVIKEANAIDKNICPLCDQMTRHLGTDLRPVFPEERFEKSKAEFINSL